MALDLKEEKTATQITDEKSHTQAPRVDTHSLEEGVWWRPLLHVGACFGVAAVVALVAVFLF